MENTSNEDVTTTPEQPASSVPAESVSAQSKPEEQRRGWFTRGWHYAVAAAVLIVVAGAFFAAGWFASAHEDRHDRAWLQEKKEHLYPRERGFYRGGQNNPRVPSSPRVPSAEQAYLGVGVSTVTPELRQRFGLSTDTGALVLSVDRNGPAFQAGLQRLDVITSIDGTPVRTQQDVLDVVTARKPGDTVSIVVNRDGQDLTFQVELGARPVAAHG
ncbi:MAG: PDZ domain-containing protein [Thermoleophilia bacterium]|nr:PDZ domain-containing protein [Thermoleophilia bacterium]